MALIIKCHKIVKFNYFKLLMTPKLQFYTVLPIKNINFDTYYRIITRNVHVIIQSVIDQYAATLDRENIIP